MNQWTTILIQLHYSSSRDGEVELDTIFKDKYNSGYSIQVVPSTQTAAWELEATQKSNVALEVIIITLWVKLNYKYGVGDIFDAKVFKSEEKE